MDKLVIMKDQQAVTTSLKVAAAFNKNHRDVLEAITAKIDSAENSAQLKSMFVAGAYKDKSGKSNKMYYMNRDGFTFIAMGFTGRKADGFKLQYIQAFNQMESHIKQFGGFTIPGSLPDALRLAADQAEKISKLQPKADYFDLQMHNPGLMTTTIIAKRYGKSAHWLNKWLESHGVIYKQGKHWIVRQHFSSEGYADYENWSDQDNKHVVPLLKWTQKGQEFIYETLKQEGILPVAELMLVP